MQLNDQQIDELVQEATEKAREYKGNLPRALRELLDEKRFDSLSFQGKNKLRDELDDRLNKIVQQRFKDRAPSAQQEHAKLTFNRGSSREERRAQIDQAFSWLDRAAGAEVEARRDAFEEAR